MDLPFISVIIPVKPGGEVRALDALSLIDYPRDRMEVIVAEGKRPSAQRNAAAKEARGDILFFLDDDSLVPPGLFRTVAARYDDPDITAVGGPILTPETDSALQQSFGLALSSIFGGSTIRARYKRLGNERLATENDLILANMSFRREEFIKACGFNERLYPNEENELMNRLQAGGHKFLYVPDAALQRSQRESYGAFVKQIFTYGRGRMDQNYAHPEGFRPLHLVPSLFLAYVLSALFIHDMVYLLPGVIYLGLCAAFSIGALDEAGDRRSVLLLPVMFVTLHLSYGAGFIWGVLKGISRGGEGPPEPVSINLRKVEV